MPMQDNSGNVSPISFTGATIPPLKGVGHYSSLHLNTLFTKLHPTVTTKWQKLGETLGIDEDLLDEIFTNNETEDECLRAVLEQWLQIHPTFEDLSDALQKIGEKQLAELLYSTSKIYLTQDNEELQTCP